jgi:hypothetical protein
MKENDVKRALELLGERDGLNNFLKRDFYPYSEHCCTAAITSGNDYYRVPIDRDTAAGLLIKEKARIAEELRKIGVEYEE